MKLTLHEVAQVLGAKNDISLYPDTALNEVEFDSRFVTTGNLFVPLKGARDGHDFIPVAFENGCAVTLSEVSLDVPHILVDDCLVTLPTISGLLPQERR